MTDKAKNVVDLVAQAVAAEIVNHIAINHPSVAAAEGWIKCSRSLSKIVRRDMKRLGDAADTGNLEAVLKAMRSERSFRTAEQRAYKELPATLARDVTPKDC